MSTRLSKEFLERWAHILEIYVLYLKDESRIILIPHVFERFLRKQCSRYSLPFLPI